MTLPREEIDHKSRRLTPAEEDRLETWIFRQDQCGNGASASIVRGLAVSILQRRGDTNRLGKHWLHSFRKRHPAIKSLKGRKQEASRFSSFTPKTVN